MDAFLLAQGVEAAEKTLTLLERIQAGGIPLLSMVIAVVCGLAFYWQLRRNVKQSEDALTKAEAREDAAKDATKVRMDEQEKLLREMLDRDREAQEGQTAAVGVVEDFAKSTRELQQTCQELNRLVRSMEARLKDLEDTIRRRHDGRT